MTQCCTSGINMAQCCASSIKYSSMLCIMHQYGSMLCIHCSKMFIRHQYGLMLCIRHQCNSIWLNAVHASIWLKAVYPRFNDVHQAWFNAAQLWLNAVHPWLNDVQWCAWCADFEAPGGNDQLCMYCVPLLVLYIYTRVQFYCDLGFCLNG